MIPKLIVIIFTITQKGMKSMFFGFLMIIIMLHILSVTCRPFSSSATIFTPHDQLTMALNQDGSLVHNRIGSSPPKCEHKCYGCSPCEATQVPTTSGVSIQYSNYEPEGWKCKCGLSFYAP